jgi:hypothetical protein
MKKTLLLGGILAASLYANAQQRLVLYEEFSGENCAPCAATNPDFWAFMTNSSNQNKSILLKYQVNIPQNSVRPLYDQNPTEADARLSYYSVNSAPNGRLDGRVHHASESSPGHPGYFAEAGGQDTMNAEMAIPSAFNVTVTPTVSGNTLTASISVTAASAFTGTTMKLRAALVEGLHYATPPGNNGEVDFHNVMRKMYPDAAGQTFPNTWTSGQNQTFTISGTIPQYVDKAADKLFLIVWIQDDANKKIAQAAKSSNLPLPALDAKITITSPANGTLYCGASNPQNKVTLKNTGTTALTSAEIYYKVGAGAYQMFAWNGPSLASGASTDVVLGNVAVAGSVTITDSVGKINTLAEINPANSVVKSSVVSTPAPAALPIASSFENGFAAGWIAMDNNNKVINTPTVRGATWFAVTQPADITAYDGSWVAVMSCADNAVGTTAILAIPYANMPAGAKALDFYYAYAKRASTGDKLEVVTSTDCGTTWQSVWSKASDALATAPPTGTNNLFLPTATNQYKLGSVDLTSLSGNTLVGFRSTSAGGNYIWLDKVNMRTGAATGLEDLVSGGTFSLYPNPVTNNLNVELNMVKAANVTFTIMNVVGQQVGQSLVKNLAQGQAKTTIATNNLTPGIYFLNVVTDKGSVQQKFIKE